MLIYSTWALALGFKCVTYKWLGVGSRKDKWTGLSLILVWPNLPNPYPCQTHVWTHKKVY